MSSYKEGQIHQLANRLEAEGFTPEEVTRLGQYVNLSDIRGLFHGTHELKLKQVKHVIDCDTDPFVPDGWSVEKHQKGGKIEWNSSKIKLYYFSKDQENSRVKLQNLAKKPVLNANVLDYLLAHSYLIPEEWKDNYILFWGTIYCDSEGGLVVRCLYWCGDEWDWFYHWLAHNFGGLRRPAVLLAS